MKLALREMARRPNRFVTATVVLTLVATLLVFIGGLLDGLVRSSTGALRAQQADAIVYSSTAQASFVRSRIDPALRGIVAQVDGVETVGGIGLVQLGARVPGNGPRDLANVALFGYELPPRGVPATPADGKAYADKVLQADGVEVGQTLLLGPARSPIEIVGFVSDTSFNGQGGLWVSPGTWREVLAANRPASQLAAGVFQALVVRGPGGAALVEAIDAATGGATQSYTVSDAVNAIPGVSEQRSTFGQIIGVTITVAMVVIALFFALLTVERTGLYGVLKALGASSRVLFTGLVAQALIVTSIATVIAASAAIVLDLLLPPGSIPLAVTPARLGTSALLLVGAAVAGCSFSLRRVLKVDPASAIGTVQ